MLLVIGWIATRLATRVDGIAAARQMNPAGAHHRPVGKG